MTGLVRNGIDTPECPCKTGVRVPGHHGFGGCCLDSPRFGRGRIGVVGNQVRVRLRLTNQADDATRPRIGFTVAAETADTIGEGHAEAGHDQSGNVGGRGSAVPRFEYPHLSARQAVPPLWQARRVLHALYLEAAGQPGTAPRPLLQVPSRVARRFPELRGPRRLTLSEPAPRTTVFELNRRLEEAYRADAAEAEQINREWEGADFGTAAVTRRGRTRAPARRRPPRGARSRRT